MTGNAEWSSEVHAADWLTRPLKRAEFGTVGSLVPAVFEAYGRLLHPAYADDMCQQRVRWSEVAAWSGRTLDRLSEFHSVAFPVGEPSTPPPWQNSPQEGSIDFHDLNVLVAMLHSHTATPDDCWMGVWNGYGASVPLVATDGDSSRASANAMKCGPPAEVAKDRPLVESHNRDYYLLHGPLETALHLDRYADTPAEGPNVFWPDDQAWCVATDVDLAWTYVSGSVSLIEDLIGSSEIEVVPAQADDACGHTEPWAVELAARAADELVRTGSATIRTYHGVIRATIDQSGLRGQRLALSRTFGDQSEGTSWTALGRGPIEEHRESIEHYLVWDIARLVG